MATFLARPLLDIRPTFEGISIGQLDDFVIRGQDGIQTPWKPTIGLKRRLKLKFLFGTKAEWRELRDFVADRLGNLTGFWVPTYLTDYVSSSQEAGSTLIQIGNIGLDQVFVADEQFAFLALIDRATIEPHEIANITEAGNGDHELNLATTITETFTTSRTVCSPLLWVRLADDSFKTEWTTNEVGRVTLDVVELTKEYGTEHTGSKPVYLYEFTKGDTVWRTCNYHEGLVVDTEYWSPENITHGGIRSNLTMIPSAGELRIRTDSSDHPLRAYVNREELEVTSVMIFRTDLDTLTIDRAAPFFSGDLGPVEFGKEGELNFVLKSIYGIGDTPFPRKRAQRTCPLNVGDNQCGVTMSTYQTTGTLDAIAADYVEATEFGNKATAESDPDWFALGKVRLNGQVRQVMGQVGDRLYINVPFRGGTAGDTIVAEAGCNKRPSHCDARFANIVNNLGFPLMPNTNPQFEALRVPKRAGGKKG